MLVCYMDVEELILQSCNQQKQKKNEAKQKQNKTKNKKLMSLMLQRINPGYLSNW